MASEFPGMEQRVFKNLIKQIPITLPLDKDNTAIHTDL